MKYPLFFTFLLLACLSGKAQTAEQQAFYQAKTQLEAMLNDKEPLSYERAILYIENAWYGNQLNKTDFDRAINFHFRNIEEIVKNNYNPKAITGKPSLLHSKEELEARYRQALTNWAIYTYMTEKLYFIDSNKINYHAPYLYSYSDPKGTSDWANTQVVHLNNTHTGNCFALASLFKILADRLHTDAKLTVAPNHIYIRHADEKGTKYNIELGRKNSFPGTGEISAVTYTTNQAIQSNIAQKELTAKEAVALTLVYLAKGYEHKFGTNNDAFIFDCAETALQYDPKNLNALLLKAEYLEDKLATQNKSIKDLRANPDFGAYQTLIATLYDLGYREMPLAMKNTLIKIYNREELTIDTAKMVNQLAARRATVSWGLYDERHADKSMERFGNTEFNTKTRKITGFTTSQPLYKNYDFDPVVFALNVDPMAHKREWLSPYNFCSNNPILRTDPTGALDDNYVFNEDGHYVRTEETKTPDKLVIENSKTGSRTDYDFNDPKTDVAAINYNINYWKNDFKDIKFIFSLTKGNIDAMMKESGVEEMNWLHRAWFVTTESNGGKLDFSMYHLSTVLQKAGEGRTWDPETEILKDKGPIFIIANQRTVYNLLDAGNYLWGNAINRLGGSSHDARKWSLMFNSRDSQADQNAIQDGWFFQDGFRDIKDCPENR